MEGRRRGGGNAVVEGRRCGGGETVWWRCVESGLWPFRFLGSVFVEVGLKDKRYWVMAGVGLVSVVCQ